MKEQINKIGVVLVIALLYATSAYALCLPHAIQGKAYFRDDSSANDASINIINQNTGEALSYTLGINGNAGIVDWYAVDLGNLPNCWSDNDVLNITATKDGYQKSILFTVDDSKGGEIVNTIYINRPPTIYSSPITTATEEVLYQYDVDANDLDGDTLTYVLTVKPDGMTINTNTGIIQWTPTNDQALAGTADVTVSVGDGEDYTEQGFTITVTNVNDPPIVSDIPDQTINEGEAFTQINLDNYVVDVDNTDNEMTWSYTGNVELIVSIVDRIATITTPNVDWNGQEIITFRATDLGLLFDEDAATFTVNAVNDAPVLDLISDTTVNETDLVTITATATDVDNTSLIYSINDTLRFTQNNNQFTWQTQLGDAGIYDVLITVSDGKLNDSQIVTITVNTIIYDITLELKQGWNLVTLPVTPLDQNNQEIQYTAETLCDKIGADTITQWDSEVQEFKGHICSGPINNFNIEKGKGVFVHVMSDIEVEFRGTTIESISVPVKSPETALGWFDPIQTTASAFPGLVTDTTRVSKIDAATQNWVSYLVSTGITDFNVEQGMGLMVNVSSDSTWNYP